MPRPHQIVRRVFPAHAGVGEPTSNDTLEEIVSKPINVTPGKQGFQRTRNGAEAPQAAAAGNPGSPMGPEATPAATVDTAWERYQQQNPTPAEALIQRLDINPERPYLVSESLYADGRYSRYTLNVELESGRARIGVTDEGETGSPVAFFRGRIQQIPLPGFASGRALAEWLADNGAQDVIDRVVAGGSVKGEYGILNEDAEAAIDELTEATEYRESEHGQMMDWREGATGLDLFPDWEPDDGPVSADDVAAAVVDAYHPDAYVNPKEDWVAAAEWINADLSASRGIDDDEDEYDWI